MGLNNSKIGFKTTYTALIAFIADFEKHLHEIMGESKIPVYFMNTGDETYYNSRFEKIDDNNEIYKHIPRVVFKIDANEIDTANITGKNSEIAYIHNNKLYSTESAKYPMEFPLIGNFVTSNFIFGIQYFEVLLTLFNTFNVYSYKYMGNNYDAQYESKAFGFEFPNIVGSGEVKNFVINFTTQLQIPIYVSEYKTIKQLNPNNNLPIDIPGNGLNPDGTPEDPNFDPSKYTPINFIIESKQETVDGQTDIYKTKIDKGCSKK